MVVFISLFANIFSLWLPLGVFGAPLASLGPTLDSLWLHLDALGLRIPLAVLGHMQLKNTYDYRRGGLQFNVKTYDYRQEG